MLTVRMLMINHLILHVCHNKSEEKNPPIDHQASPVPVENWEEGDGAATVASFKTYLWSIIYMPASLR